jgi:hypothetical protein
MTKRIVEDCGRLGAYKQFFVWAAAPLFKADGEFIGSETITFAEFWRHPRREPSAPALSAGGRRDAPRADRTLGSTCPLFARACRCAPAVRCRSAFVSRAHVRPPSTPPEPVGPEASARAEDGAWLLSGRLRRCSTRLTGARPQLHVKPIGQSLHAASPSASQLEVPGSRGESPRDLPLCERALCVTDDGPSCERVDG